MKLLGLIGYAGVGKDTLCQKIGWHRAAFADELKQDLADFLGVTVELMNANKDVFRPIMVEYGVVMRHLQPGHWIKRLESELFAGELNLENACVTDTRYLDEAQWILNKGGLLIRVRRADASMPANQEEARSIREIDESGIPMLQVYNTNDEGTEQLKWIVESKFKGAAA